MDIQQQIAKVWQDYENKDNIPAVIKERRYGFYDNLEQKDILILGIAPIYHAKSVSKPTKYDILHHLGDQNNMNAYQRAITKIVKSEQLKLDLSPCLTYMDLFYYRTDINQTQIRTILETLDGILFLIDQLKITQKILEQIIQPKVIILNSEEAGIFMGIYQDDVASICSMDYLFEEIEHNPCSFSVYKIIGRCTDKSMVKYDKHESNLIGTYVICYPPLLNQTAAIENTSLAPEKIAFYRDLFNVEKNAKSSSPASLSQIDVDLLINYNFLWRYRLKGDNDPLAIYANLILQDVMNFKKLTPQKMVKAVFNKVCELNSLTQDDILDLFSSSYCATNLKHKKPILATKQTVELNKNGYFIKAFNLGNRQFFYVAKFWSRKQRAALERWFITIAYLKHHE